MNCKAGDLAYIVGKNRYAGTVVQVIEAAPIGMRFRLPDGHLQAPQSYEWVCYFPTAVEVGVHFVGDAASSRMTHYATVPDRCLCPIGGVPVHDEQHDEVTA
ncbi:hypothetical protein [Cupriavidus basilensis]